MLLARNVFSLPSIAAGIESGDTQIGFCTAWLEIKQKKLYAITPGGVRPARGREVNSRCIFSYASISVPGIANAIWAIDPSSHLASTQVQYGVASL